jgi:hypothetical protein
VGAAGRARNREPVATVPGYALGLRAQNVLAQHGARSMTSPAAPVWRDKLFSLRVNDRPLLDPTFLDAWGNEPWQPEEADRNAAGELHVQLVSRITTQPLAYGEGNEAAALRSLHQLFDKTRDIMGRHLGCRHVDTIGWHVINTWVRPFTAKWHRLGERGDLDALDASDVFRAELVVVQQAFSRLDDLLVEIRDGRPPPAQPVAGRDRERRIADAMAQPLRWGIDARLGGIEASEANDINDAERKAITARRTYYAFDEEKEHAVGLAISGGGIRSATFALGVLVALARRNLLPQFDYLSTVSGGGYLGSFLTTYLNSEQKPDEMPLGLGKNQLPFRRTDGEAEALRHIRHFSKYLATGSLWERAKMTTAQLYGLAINALGVAFLGACAALIEFVLRRGVGFGPVVEWLGWLALIGLAAASIVVPLRLRRGGAWDRADTWLAIPAVALVAVIGWNLLGTLHALYAIGTTRSVSGSLSVSELLVIAAVIAALLAAGIVGFFSTLPALVRLTLSVIAAVAAPVFILGADLAAFRWMEYNGWTCVVLLLAALVVATVFFFFVLNINFTSPHRHYRKKLGEAYLIQQAPDPKPAEPFASNVRLLLSNATAHPRAPYHLINCALNVPGSDDLKMQGRLTDFFLFSPAFCGSPLVRYERTTEWEKADPHLDVGTAMAISGAAAAPQMGLGTMRQLTFWLALLNIRLSYWARDPRRLSDFFSTPTLWHLFQEMFGLAHEEGHFLNLSDGGHIENLGVYELLRRRCKFIVAIDGEQDPKMTFQALTTLQRLAYIDLGVKIEINLDDLRLNARGMTRSHFGFSRIAYPRGSRDGEPAYGYFLYVKLSLTGNEGEFLRRYRLDEPDFPHHSTADQFFTEAQFEAYRSLGEHVGDKLFLPAIIGGAETAPGFGVESWFTAIGKSMLDG